VLGTRDDEGRIARLETGREIGSDGVRQLAFITVDLNAMAAGRGTTQKVDPTSRHDWVVTVRRSVETLEPAVSATITMAA
jgi:hypothetical protein